jgi:hypothetical protein
MNIFALSSRSVELWRQATPDIAGWNAQPSPLASCFGHRVSVREYPCYVTNAWLAKLTDTASGWITRPKLNEDAKKEARKETTGDKEMRKIKFNKKFAADKNTDFAPALTLALFEHPLARVRAVWEYMICSRHQQALNSRRFAGMWFCTWPDFVRWLMHQDPLGVDPLLQPQWAMVPEGTQWIEASAAGLHHLAALLKKPLPAGVELPPLSVPVGLPAEILTELYAADMAIWKRNFSTGCVDNDSARAQPATITSSVRPAA